MLLEREKCSLWLLQQGLNVEDERQDAEKKKGRMDGVYNSWPIISKLNISVILGKLESHDQV